jgi:O-glycosyl hydrolase
MKPIPVFLLAVSLALATSPVYAQKSVSKRLPRETPAAAEGTYAIFPAKNKQVIWGLGFEIQSDSIGSGNNGLPDEMSGVPHDLIPSERKRFATEMLAGFRYCRLAGGLYWRGLDPENKHLQPRWPEQLAEIKDMLDTAGVEGVLMEYWSPPPFWKANGKYTGKDGTENILRCYGKDFANDPVYHGDKQRFIQDFAQAQIKDLETLKASGIKTVMWGLQNEPTQNEPYSTCRYTPEQYFEIFPPVATLVRKFDPKITIISDSMGLGHAAPVLKHPEYSKLIDALAIHQIGSDSNVIPKTVEHIWKRYGKSRPVFQNEYEYSAASYDHCLNTAQHIMNWIQLGDAPTWFWIHALKPVKNSESSGYSLGFWRPLGDTTPKKDKFADLQPGHWTWNKYNWNAVGSFVKHMPWNSQSVEVKEGNFDNDLRIMAFKRPNGKLTIVLSNRSFTEHTFKIATGLQGATFKGYRYNPDDAGQDSMGVPCGTLAGGTITPKLADMTWEFWEQQ